MTLIYLWWWSIADRRVGFSPIEWMSMPPSSCWRCLSESEIRAGELGLQVCTKIVPGQPVAMSVISELRWKKKEPRMPHEGQKEKRKNGQAPWTSFAPRGCHASLQSFHLSPSRSFNKSPFTKKFLFFCFLRFSKFS